MLALAFVLLLTVACKSGGAGGNQLLNPGFEEGVEPWISLDPESKFELSQAQANSGAYSALLKMDVPVEAGGSRVYYLVQEVTPDKFPEVVRGFYRVENWNRGTAKQYLQFVVIALGADNNPLGGQVDNYQLRYLLAGIDREPFRIGNAQFIYISQEEPVQDQWVSFEAEVKNDFQRYWGAVPEGYDKLRILFEVRYDDKVAGDGAPRADVFYDDLYFGSAK
jgi:hypothetical protein